MSSETGYLFGGLALGWLSLAFGYLVYRVFYKRWRRWRYGDQIDHSVLLTEFGRKLTTIQDLTALEQLLVDEVPPRLQVRQAVLLVPDKEHPTTFAGGELSVPSNHAAVRSVAAAGEAQRADHGRLRELIDQSRVDLTWTRIWVPLMRGTSTQGIWLLGNRDSNMRYATEDLRWLTAIAREAAAVIEAFHHAKQERAAATEMRAMYRQIVRTREMERGRVSRELHDGILQDLCAVTRDLKMLETQGNLEKGSLPELIERSGETVQALRAICNGLRPPFLQKDLSAVLEAMVRDMDDRSATPISIKFSPGSNEINLPDEAALAIFRIVQEALNNAVNHADASEIAVRITTYPDRLRLTVADDGCGIRGGRVDSAHFVAQGHFGLAGMRERAAMIGAGLDIQTAVDYGTVVVLDLPAELNH
ncbi:MAG TPA: sensor histidine kinase [Anaerolineae bacterium]|jgi:signal transduction histidine kinase|nr:sensor histidine kinase [Anaerolineae bacterium]